MTTGGERDAGSGLDSIPGNVKVVCRFRPLNDRERRESDKVCVVLDGNGTTVDVVSVDGYSDRHTFHFDRIFGFDSAQEQVYNTVAKPVVDGLFEGYNGTIIAYGQTASGKTFTMEGSDIDDPELRGITPRVVDTVFEMIEASPPYLDFTLKVSMVEIYLEKLRDLIDTFHDNLEIREHKDTGIYVEGLSEHFVTSPAAVYDKIRRGSENRATASTNMNRDSSRSHSVFILTLIQKNLETLACTTGKLYLVDLAGSEKVRKTGASGILLDQAKKINLSLTQLGIVINALTDGSASHVPYRDSKLTRLLQESLGGNSRTSLIVNCSPAFVNREETVSTLRFGVRAKRMVNNPRANKERSAAELKILLEQREHEIARLKKRIAVLEAKLASHASGARVTPSGGSSGMPAPYRTMSDSALEAVVGGMAEDALEASALRDDVARLQAELESSVDRVSELTAENLALRERIAELEDEVQLMREEVRHQRETHVEKESTARELANDLDLLVHHLTFGSSVGGAVVPWRLQGSPSSTSPSGAPVSPVKGDDLGRSTLHTSTFSMDDSFSVTTATPTGLPSLDPAGFRNPKTVRLVSVLSKRLEALAAKEKVDEPSPSTKAMVAQLQASVHDLSERVQAGATRLSDTIQQLQRAREELGDRSAALAASQAQVEALTTNLKLTEQRCTSLNEERLSLTEKVASTAADLESVTGLEKAAVLRADGLADQLALSNQQCEDLNKRVVEEEKANQALTEQLRSIALKAGKESTQFDERHAATLAELESTQNSLRIAKQTIDDMERAGTAARSDTVVWRGRHDQMSTLHADVSRKLEAANAALAASMARTAVAEASLKEVEVSLQSKAMDATSLQAQLDAKQAEIVRLQGQVEAMPSRVDAAVATACIAVADDWSRRLQLAQEEAAQAERAVVHKHQTEVTRMQERLKTLDRIIEERDQLREELAARGSPLVDTDVTDKEEEEEEPPLPLPSFDDDTITHVELQEALEANLILRSDLREARKNLARTKRQRNMAISECNNRKLEVDILKSAARALETRLEIMARDVRDAELTAGRARPYTGMPALSPERNDVQVRLNALEEVVSTQMAQLRAKGQALVDMESREQKLLLDLKSRCQKVVDLQELLDSKEEELKAASKAIKREKMTKMANDLLKQTLSESEEKNQAMERFMSEVIREKQLLERKLGRALKRVSELEEGSLPAATPARGAQVALAPPDATTLLSPATADLMRQRSLRGGGGRGLTLNADTPSGTLRGGGGVGGSRGSGSPSLDAPGSSTSPALTSPRGVGWVPPPSPRLGGLGGGTSAHPAALPASPKPGTPAGARRPSAFFPDPT